MDQEIHSSFTPQVGVLIDERYELLELIGTGTIGTAFRTADCVLDRSIITTKFIHRHLLEDETIKENIEDALTKTRQLSHPNIIRTYNFEHINGTSFISSEYIAGWSLEAILENRSRHPLPTQMAVRTLFYIAQALSYAHNKKIVHGNIKPSNILISEDGEVKVIDFCISQALEHEKGLTLSGETIAAPQFMAPEIFLGNEATPSSDVYALALLAYRMLTGSLPFTSNSFMDLARTHLSGTLSSDMHFNKNKTPQWLERLIIDCLEKEPENRPKDAGEVLQELKNQEVHSTELLPKKKLKKIFPKSTSVVKKRIRSYLFGYLAMIPLIFVILVMERRSRYAIFTPAYLIVEDALGADWEQFRRTLRIIGPLRDPHAPLALAPLDKNPDFKIGALRGWIRAGGDPNLRYPNGKPMVHELFYHLRDEEQLEFFLDHGLDINIRENKKGKPENFSLLHHVASVADAATIDLVLRKGGDPYSKTPVGYTPFHLALSRHEPEVIEVFLRNGNFVDQRGPDGEGTLSFAIRHFDNETQSKRTVEQLLQAGAPLHHRSDVGQTALHYAVLINLPDIVKMLLDAGAEDSIDGYGNTALTYAVAQKDKENEQLIRDAIAREDKQ